jgi:hypothetical protein
MLLADKLKKMIFEEQTYTLTKMYRPKLLNATKNLS